MTHCKFDLIMWRKGSTYYSCKLFHENACIFCEECCGILLTMEVDTNVRNMAADLQDIAWLHGHSVKSLSRRGLVERDGVMYNSMTPVRTTLPAASQA